MVAGAPVRPGGLTVLWQSLRPRSLTVAAVSSVTGTAVLVPQRSVQAAVALGCLLLALLLQAATNVLNDAEDALTGADDHAAAGSSLSMRRGWITPAQARRIAAALFAAAAALGLGIALATHRPGLLGLGLVAIAVGWAYTAPPLRLAYRPLGEAASGLPMGLGIVWGTAAAQTSSVPTAAWWAGAALALLTAGILHANNARDRAHDTAVGKRTLATRLSEGAVVAEYRGLLGGVPLVLAIGLATRGLPWWDLLAILPAGLAVRSAWRAHRGLDGMGWTHRLIECVQLHLLTGIALGLGSVLSGIR
jgi:1,4-dihydroxy-2-naphthoate octaprenyltransferase